MSKPASGPDVSIRNAFSLFAPNATTCAALTKDPTSVGAKYIVPTASQPVRRSRRVTVHTRQVAGAAFLSYTTLAMLSAEQTNCGFVSAFHEPCPKNQRQT
eukprot:3107200-Rhodomonas_salina.1